MTQETPRQAKIPRSPQEVSPIFRSHRERQMSLFEQKGIPQLPEPVSPMNNNLARSPLFTPGISKRRGGRRRVYNDEPIMTQGDCRIEYSGEQLDMGDQDVFLEALTLASRDQAKPNQRITVNRAEFMNAIGLTRSGQNYKKLERSFLRLSKAHVVVRTPDGFNAYHLLTALQHDSHTGQYYFSIPLETFSLFLDQNFAYINMIHRLEFKESINMAKWLQTYASTHEKPGHFVIGLEKLKDLCGFEGRLRQFREVIREALQENVRVGELAWAKVDADDNVMWERPTMDPFSIGANTKNVPSGGQVR